MLWATSVAQWKDFLEEKIWRKGKRIALKNLFLVQGVVKLYYYRK